MIVKRSGIRDLQYIYIYIHLYCGEVTHINRNIIIEKKGQMPKWRAARVVQTEPHGFPSLFPQFFHKIIKQGK